MTNQTTAEVTKTAEVVAEKTPSKKSQADTIFQAKLADLKSGVFTSNKAFRAAVIAEIIAKLGVSVASAATCYNSAKVTAEAADATVVLGRDPKKAKAPSTGTRGRKAGSKNAPKEVVDTAAVTGEAVAATAEVAADATV